WWAIVRLVGYCLISLLSVFGLQCNKKGIIRLDKTYLKPSNILPDVNMNPKFLTLAWLEFLTELYVKRTHKKVLVHKYGLKGNFSEKSDVYNFGVILLGIVSSRRNSSLFNSEDYHMNLVGCCHVAFSDKRRLGALERRKKYRTDRFATLKDHSTIPEILSCIHVGLLCVQDKPTMSNVITMIADEAVSLPDPKPVAFLTRQEVEEFYSLNGVTNSWSHVR
ncbi:hypothetical protein TorRG33x02_283470, partial [Trema orientale]